MPRQQSRQSASRAIIENCRSMNALGINQGTSGNISVRWKDGYLITPSGVNYDDMLPEQMVFMRLDGSWEGDWKPSSEWRMHRDIYAARPEAGAVVHTHANHCAALACHRMGIPAFHYMVAIGGGADIRCADYATFGTQALSDNMLAALEERCACLLANHGMICFGADLKKAMRVAVELEALASQYWRALQLGRPDILDDDQMAEVLERFQTYGRQRADAAG